MDFIKILEFVRRTNPEMTIEKLIDKLGGTKYYWTSLEIYCKKN